MSNFQLTSVAGRLSLLFAGEGRGPVLCSHRHAHCRPDADCCHCSGSLLVVVKFRAAERTVFFNCPYSYRELCCSASHCLPWRVVESPGHGADELAVRGPVSNARIFVDRDRFTAQHFQMSCSCARRLRQVLVGTRPPDPRLLCEYFRAPAPCWRSSGLGALDAGELGAEASTAGGDLSGANRRQADSSSLSGHRRERSAYRRQPWITSIAFEASVVCHRISLLEQELIRVIVFSRLSNQQAREVIELV